MLLVYKPRESCTFVAISPVPVPRRNLSRSLTPSWENLYSGKAELRRVCCVGGGLSGALISLWSCLELMSCSAACGTGSKVSPTQVH